MVRNAIKSSMVTFLGDCALTSTDVIKPTRSAVVRIRKSFLATGYWLLATGYFVVR